MTKEEHTDVVEIDAIANEEWERDQHTPQAIESNLAALVKQSASASSGPVRQLDEAWEDPDVVKPRTTTNTLRRADDGKRSKTMALPATVKPPSTKSTSQGLTPVAAKTTPPAATPVVKPPKSPEPKLAKSSSPALTPVAKPEAKKTSSPALTPVAAKPEAKPALTPVAAKPEAKPAKTSSPALTPVAAKSEAKPAKTSSPALTPVAAKPEAPVAKPTPAPVVAKPEAKPTPAKTSSPALTPVAAKPEATPAKPAPVAAKPVEPTPVFARAATPSPLALPAWPPKADQSDYEDWENPNGATSVGNRVPPKPRAVSEDAISSFLKEDSIIIDLNAVPKQSESPRRPQTYPVIQTSDNSTTTSGVFDMPSPSAATVVLPLPAPAPELETVALRPSSAWNTPLPQPLPGEPKAVAPTWPSAAGLDRGLAVPQQIKSEPTEPAVARRPRLATVFAGLQRRRNAVLIATGVSVLVLLVEFAIPSGSSKSPTPEPVVATHVAARTTTPAAQTPATDTTVAKRPAVAAIAAVDEKAPAHTKPATPAKQQPARRRISRKRPIVVDYDKKPDPSPSQDEALANARTAYAAGNQHLFAGEAAAAVTSYKQALADYPQYAAGYRGLGLAYSQQGDPTSALTAFKSYVKLAPAAKDMQLIMKRITRLNAVVAMRH